MVPSIAASQSVISPIVDGNKSKTSYTAKEDPTEDDNFIFPANPTEESPSKTELVKASKLSGQKSAKGNRDARRSLKCGN